MRDKSVKTFEDFLRVNPEDYPTQRTFYFYKIAMPGSSEEGAAERVRELVYEGTFEEPTENGLPRRTTSSSSQTASMGDSAPQRHAISRGQQHPVTPPSASPQENRESIKDVMQAIIDDLRLNLTRKEQELMAERAEKQALQKKIDENTEKMLEVERKEVRLTVERDTTQTMHRMEIEQLKTDHQRELAQLRQDHERALESAREEVAEETENRLQDEFETTSKSTQMKLASFAERVPEYLELGRSIVEGFRALTSKTREGIEQGAINADMPSRPPVVYNGSGSQPQESRAGREASIPQPVQRNISHTDPFSYDDSRATAAAPSAGGRQ
ncbi:MAG: hypothetical protein HYX66_08930 [Ignavibacteria bacterium]|nr:hypothetical protein [Ignavibacteria bacterium]